MSALVAILPLVPVPRLQRLGVRARLERAERALDQPFDQRRSLELDRLVLRVERTMRRETDGRRRAA